MSGGVFRPHSLPFEDIEEVSQQQSPLVCCLCNETFEDPRLLQCFHTFCSRCLRGQAVQDTKIACPLCGKSSVVEDVSELPSVDLVTEYLVEKATTVKSACCANCDREQPEMCFCNTCCQPLCAECQAVTHRARMFAAHDIVPLSQGQHPHTPSRCESHKEPYIMFSVDSHQLLCIKCFRDLSTESRSQCVDLDTAYTRGCASLHQATKAMEELQSAVRDGILLLRGLLDEVTVNSQQERQSISATWQQLQEALQEQKDKLLQDVQRQHAEKESDFRQQLTSLCTAYPMMHQHLSMCQQFVESASQVDFLELGYSLIERLSSLSRKSQPLQPIETAQIKTNFKIQLARCLEPVLEVLLGPQLISPRRGLAETLAANSRMEHPLVPSLPSSPGIAGSFAFTSSGTLSGSAGLVQNGGRKVISVNGSKVILVETGSAFADHCKEFDIKHKEILQVFETVKKHVQELQRDVTLRRCLAKNTKVGDIISQCAYMDDIVNRHMDGLQIRRLLLEKHWEEVCQQINTEQEIYQAQLNDISRLQQESQYLSLVAKQLVPFIKSIGSLSERISPRLGESFRSAEHEDQVQAMLHKISSLEPDSQQRVNAIIKTEEDRQMQAASRVNPLDSELIRTKEMLKSIRKEKEDKAGGSKAKNREGEMVAESATGHKETEGGNAENSQEGSERGSLTEEGNSLGGISNAKSEQLERAPRCYADSGDGMSNNERLSKPDESQVELLKERYDSDSDHVVAPEVVTDMSRSCSKAQRKSALLEEGLDIDALVVCNLESPTTRSAGTEGTWSANPIVGSVAATPESGSKRHDESSSEAPTMRPATDPAHNEVVQALSTGTGEPRFAKKDARNRNETAMADSSKSSNSGTSRDVDIAKRVRIRDEGAMAGDSKGTKFHGIKDLGAMGEVCVGVSESGQKSGSVGERCDDTVAQETANVTSDCRKAKELTRVDVKKLNTTWRNAHLETVMDRSYKMPSERKSKTLPRRWSPSVNGSQNGHPTMQGMTMMMKSNSLELQDGEDRQLQQPRHQQQHRQQHMATGGQSKRPKSSLGPLLQKDRVSLREMLCDEIVQRGEQNAAKLVAEKLPSNGHLMGKLND